MTVSSIMVHPVFFWRALQHLQQSILHSAFCLLPFAFCLLPFAFCLLPFAFCLMQVQSVCLFTISLFVGALKPVNANKHPAGNANIISKVFTVFG